MAKHFSTLRRLFDNHGAITDLFAIAGVTLNGTAPWDIGIHHDRFYRRVMADGSLGLGKAYLDGDWDCRVLDQFFDRVISANLGDRLGITLPLIVLRAAAKVQNRQTRRRASDVAYAHYNLPIEIHEATYDNRLTGSCAY